MLSGRGGLEDRDRAIGTSSTNGYAEFTVLYRYLTDSFLSAGVLYDTQETSNPINFSDEEVLTFFANVQHAFSSSLIMSGSIYYDDAELQAQLAAANIKDNTLRFGISLTWQPTQNWSVIFSYDLDSTDSDSFFRREDRSRVGIVGRYSFGL